MDSQHALTPFFFILLSVISVSSVQLPVLTDDENIMAFLYKGFLSQKECDHLINVARHKLQRSMVSDIKSGKAILSKVRTSSGMFLFKAQVLSTSII
ncbi:putative procollagen-proline 4-dioxygenase [Lupinus albus]|uniref:Putative procollagen-proline 4-dioxygenase n=1 Tax=Lupinus albus TaxID=3870 RepID=A0A6A4QM85_LUPAL|nr:putative procollagen-proline 4-dioxygenase [Lupinus albus]